MENTMKRNVKLFNFLEVYDAPIPHDSFLHIFGHDGLTCNAEVILRRDYKFPPVIHPNIIEFFSFIKMTDEMLQGKFIWMNTACTNFTSFWKAGRKKIFSSMSTIHNGHYIASATLHLLCAIIKELAIQPWDYGVSLNRWRRSLNVVLEKVPGVRLLTKLQTIHLHESDFNTGTKLFFAQRMMVKRLR